MGARVHAVRRRSGIRALLRGLKYRLLIPLLRSTHSPEYTARGVANGVFWGLTPTVGLQTLEITSTWLVGRTIFGKDSSLLQAYIWVWVNNPVTMVPMYYTFYLTGLLMLGSPSGSAGYEGFVTLWTTAAAMDWWDGFLAIVRAIGAPLFVGAVPYAVIGTALSYRWAVLIVRRRQQRVRQV
jgi:uncharacterized protein (DUF2062 family)